MGIKINVVIGVICLSLGAYLEYKFNKPEVLTQIVTHDVIKEQVVTVTHTVHDKDGSTVTDSTTTQNTVDTSNTKLQVIAPHVDIWQITAGYAPLSNSYTVGASHRFIGPLWLGTQISTQGQALLTLSVQF